MRREVSYIPIVLITVVLCVGSGCMSRELSQVRSDIDELKEEVKRLKEKNDQINRKLQEARGNLQELEASSKKVDDKMAQLERELREVKARFQEEGNTLSETDTVSLSVEQLYARGLEIYKSEDYSGAELIFRQVLGRFPHSDLADNAQFWIGACYYMQKNFTRAAAEFRKVVDNYPFGNKVPDALLRIGDCYEALGDTNKAIATLQELINSFPHTDASAQAAKKLRLLKGEPP
ncbi:MAG: tol-pal system protein YbgF [Acidobacteriota bacterium]